MSIPRSRATKARGNKYTAIADPEVLAFLRINIQIRHYCKQAARVIFRGGARKKFIGTREPKLRVRIVRNVEAGMKFSRGTAYNFYNPERIIAARALGSVAELRGELPNRLLNSACENSAFDGICTYYITGDRPIIEWD